MIVYGTGSKLLKEASAENIPCSNCEHKTSTISVYQKYFDLFWIPTFPIGKAAFLECENCHNVTKEKAMQPEQKALVKNLKKSLKTPLYTFSGLGVISLIVGGFILSGMMADNEKEDYYNEPQRGDVYSVLLPEEPTEFKHIFYKITNVSEDSIFVLVSYYGYVASASVMEPKDAFIDYEYGIAKTEVQQWHEADRINNIYRGYSDESGFDKVLSWETLEEMNEGAVAE